MSALVVGASGGIGGALVRALVASGRHDDVFALSRSAQPIDGATALPCDVLDEASIAAAAGRIGAPRLVIIASGILHGDGLEPEKALGQVTLDGLTRAFQINAAGPALVAKHFLPLMPKTGRAVFAALSARVGSISDNRLGGWHGYRASKAALNMLIRTIAVELGRTHPEAIAVALHPGTVETRLSAPFRASVPKGKLFGPDDAATRLIQVIDGLDRDDSGRLFAWDGRPIPF